VYSVRLHLDLVAVSQDGDNESEVTLNTSSNCIMCKGLSCIITLFPIVGFVWSLEFTIVFVVCVMSGAHDFVLGLSQLEALPYYNQLNTSSVSSVYNRGRCPVGSTAVTHLFCS
jgi:hypothetical protein